MKVTERRGRRSKQALDDLKETERYWKLKKKHELVFPGELALE
jgi:hypothetical protein